MSAILKLALARLRCNPRAVVLAMVSILAACGGGNGSGDTSGSGPVVTTPPPVPTLEVTLSPSATSQSGTETGNAVTLVLDASFTGNSSENISPDLSFDPTILSLDGPIVRTGNSFRAVLRSTGALGAASYVTEIRFRLCKEAGCATVYPGSTKSFAYTLDIPILDWVTHQRNPAHTGYVRATFDPTKFAEAWTFPAPSTPVASDAFFNFNPVVARVGMVYTTFQNIAGGRASDLWIAQSLNGVSGAAGHPQWAYQAGTSSGASAPALISGLVMYNTGTSAGIPGNRALVDLIALSAAPVARFGDGARREFGFAIPSQQAPYPAPTPFGDQLFVATGDTGSLVYGFSVTPPTRLWTRAGSAGGTWRGLTPAVDAQHVYFYSGALDVIDRATGGLVKSIADPAWRGSGYAIIGGPMIAAANNVIAYSSTGSDTATAFPLVSYDIAGARVRWRTAETYTTAPAAAKGVVYAGSNTVRRLDAIDQESGAVLWSWSLPSGQAFVGNVVVTDNLAFVSTTSAVHAIDLGGSHASKWSAAGTGWLTITPDAMLVVADQSGSAKRLVAYKLR